MSLIFFGSGWQLHAARGSAQLGCGHIRKRLQLLSNNEVKHKIKIIQFFISDLLLRCHPRGLGGALATPLLMFGYFYEYFVVGT
jgi:hypothetical protein